jgi:hypothetical protein
MLWVYEIHSSTCYSRGVEIAAVGDGDVECQLVKRRHTEAWSRRRGRSLGWAVCPSRWTARMDHICIARLVPWTQACMPITWPLEGAYSLATSLQSVCDSNGTQRGRRSTLHTDRRRTGPTEENQHCCSSDLRQNNQGLAFGASYAVVAH